MAEVVVARELFVRLCPGPCSDARGAACMPVADRIQSWSHSWSQLCKWPCHKASDPMQAAAAPCAMHCQQYAQWMCVM